VKVLQHATLSDQQEGRYYSDHLPVLAVVDLVK
jgi:endonuclease/exonuclease/phosphatase family metal-dependent hydrolase